MSTQGKSVWTDHFTASFRDVTRSLQVNDAALARLFPLLLETFTSGRGGAQCVEIIMRELPEGSWKWPAFDEQFGPQPTRKMAEVLQHRIWHLTFHRRHQEQFLRTVDIAPYKMFAPIKDDRTPNECRDLDGIVKHHEDQFWHDHSVPCSRLDCRCTWIALSAKDVIKLGKGAGAAESPATDHGADVSPAPRARGRLPSSRAAFLRWLDGVIARRRK